MTGDAEAARRDVAVGTFTAAFVADEAVQPALLPPLPLEVEGGLLPGLEEVDRLGVGFEFFLIDCVGEFGFLYPQGIAAVREGRARLGQLVMADREEAYLVEEVEQPWLSLGKGRRLAR